MQVFPHVLHVCELGLCCTDPASDPELETPLQILPLVCIAYTKTHCENRNTFVKVLSIIIRYLKPKNMSTPNVQKT